MERVAASGGTVNGDTLVLVHICGKSPRNKEIGDTLFTSLLYNHMLYGLWLDKVGCANPDPTGQVMVEGLL